MGSKSRRRFSAEFKAETVRLVEQSDQRELFSLTVFAPRYHPHPS